MLRLAASAALFLACAADLPAQAPPAAAHAASGAITANANTRPAGTLRGGVLTLRLEVRRGTWHPLADDGPALAVYAFAEEGRPASIPGPLVRVPVGTRIRVSIRNLLDSAVVMHGLRTRPQAEPDTLGVAPGAVRRVEFLAGAAGTYFYWGNTSGLDVPSRYGADSQLSGALIVDEPGAPRDRVFVLGTWSTTPDTSGRTHPEREVSTFNGKAWPYSERLTLREGAPVRWRVINASRFVHPMHLHGFYFDLLSRGGWGADTVFAADRSRRAVTEALLAGGTNVMRWTPSRPGNWLFHCHFSNHVADRLAEHGPSAHAAGGMEEMGGMSGLVLGLHVLPRGGARRAAPPEAAPRRLRLLVNQRPNHYGDRPAMGYVLQEGAEPARDSVPFPSAMLVLRQGEPVAITVVNRLREPTSVHWHGLEIESFPDGVPGWSGSRGRLMPMIAPGDSFTARFTPPRAGTFIYHTHLGEVEQMIAGLYGALIVLGPGERWDPERDLVVLVGAGPPPRGFNRASGLVNGSTRPAPLSLRAGTRYRVRVVSINSEWRVRFALTADGVVQRWRALARDGADLEPWAAVEQPATMVSGAGETADFAWTPPAAGRYTLDVTSNRPGWRIPLALVVTPPVASP
ncbi:MAG: multicopper oxidase domain-containing protein [Longimicrobiaceae bacterium]